MSDEKVGVKVGLTGSIPVPPAEAANFFHFTRVGEEVQFLVGSINLLRLHEVKQQGESETVVVPQITHRFLLSPLGFAALKGQLDDIAKSVPKSGITITNVADE